MQLQLSVNATQSAGGGDGRAGRRACGQLRGFDELIALQVSRDSSCETVLHGGDNSWRCTLEADKMQGNIYVLLLGWVYRFNVMSRVVLFVI